MSLRDYGVAAPHGPNMGGEHVATQDVHGMNPNEAGVFKAILHPDDIYDENGVYWADMPLGQRFKFINKVDSAEAKKETTAILQMIKADPLSPVGYYAKNMVIPGAGLLLEGFVGPLVSKLFNWLNVVTAMFCSRSAMLGLYCKRLSLPAGRSSPSAMRFGPKLLIISRFVELFVVRQTTPTNTKTAL